VKREFTHHVSKIPERANKYLDIYIFRYQIHQEIGFFQKTRFLKSRKTFVHALKGNWKKEYTKKY